MKFKVIYQSARKAVIELIGQGYYETEKSYEVYVNNELYTTSNRTVLSIHNLLPKQHMKSMLKMIPRNRKLSQSLLPMNLLH